MKERLVELIKQDNCMNPMTCSDKCPYVDLDDCHSARLADHLLANGVIVPPCKVGQTVYRIIEMSTGVMMNSTYTIKRFIRTVEVTKNNFFDVCENWGKTVFLTKEEAEAKLKERKEDV